MTSYAPAPATSTRTGNGMATAGLVLSIVGIFLFNIILGPLGIIFGAIGWSNANRGASGKAMAVSAVIIGVIDVLLFVGLVALAANNNGRFVWHV